MNIAIGNLTYRDIFLWRIATAIFWSIILQALFLIAFLVIINFNPWHPVIWIQHSVAISVSLGTWLYICPLGMVICAQGMVCCKDFVMVNKYCGSRFSIFCNIFSLRNLIICILHVIIGGFITWIYLSLLGGKYSKLVTECGTEPKRNCLVEEYIFLILNGVWIGIYFFLHNYIFGSKALLFPVVQQLKFLQVKAELQPLLKQAMVDAFTPTLYFVILYYWKGGTIQYFVQDLVGYNVEDRSLDTIFGFLNLSLLFYAWFFSSMFMLTMYTMKLLFQVTLTEHTVFPVTAMFGHHDCPTLYQALAMADIPIIQHLGFLDLKILAEKDRARREELFTLSQPGGHPHNWNAVVEEGLKLINTFTENLNRANSEGQPMADTKQTAPVQESTPITSTFRMRNMSLRAADLACQSQGGAPPLQPTPFESAIRALKLQWVQTLDALCKKPGICFAFGELPDAKVRFQLAQAQPVVWAVQGLSRLAATSFSEDAYGVVQKDLPAIIAALLCLKQSVDRLQKAGNYKRVQRAEHEARMKAALRSAVKRSLYCICIAFGDFVKELPLSKDALQQLHCFLAFREG
ncbi:nucleoporin NDC1 [Periplaneta americana]|uniref:nucleoporin NDC1 n=1 Tax=Periplaneta americana TaxID=6978 RepID=UPI0037E79B9E